LCSRLIVWSKWGGRADTNQSASLSRGDTLYNTPHPKTDLP